MGERRAGSGERKTRHRSPLTAYRLPLTAHRSPKMKCPFCGSLDTQVIDSRVNEAGDAIRLRRRCAACDKRFTTWETAELRPPQIVKSNGTREDFSETKLREGFRRALHKRPLSTELADAVVVCFC